MDKSKLVKVNELTAEQERTLLAELGSKGGASFLLTPEMYSKITEDTQQAPTSRCLPDHLKGCAEYAGPAVITTSLGPVAIMVSYLFDAAELEAAGEDEGNLPWDYQHVEAERSAILGF